MRKKMTGKANARGYTLIEILIVVAIMGILASVAVPSYQRSVLASNRSVAQAGLLDLANRMEQYYLDNRTYTATLTNLGLPAGMVFADGGDSTIAVNENQTLVAAAAADRMYFLKVTSATATTFSISAIPQLVQAGDSECATFTLTNTGLKSVSGSVAATDCW